MSQIENIDDLDTAKQFLRLFEKENERLHEKIAKLVTEVAELRGQNAAEQLALELAKLQEQLANLQRKTFGSSSERRSDHEAKPEPAPEKKPQTGHGPRKQQLPQQTVLRQLAEEDRSCPACGDRLQEMIGVSEDSELITVVQRQFVLQTIKRQKYRCGCHIGVHTAPAPTKPIPGGRYSLEFAVDVAVSKYADHLPLERQRRIMAREGLIVDTQTLWDQLDALAEHVRPTYDAMREYVLSADLIGADETWWRLMDESSSKKWWAWGITTYDAVWYGIDPSRSSAAAKKALGDFSGVVMCDGYSAYDTVASAGTGVRLVHCWAHARRKFIESQVAYPAQSKIALDFIDELFRIDRELDDPEPLDGDEREHALEARRRARAERSKPVLDQLRTWALGQMALPRSGLRKAIEYMLRYWKGLTAFVDQPLVPLDNNRTERALRGMVLGRKNHYGSRSRRGTEVAAILYTLIETAKLRGVDPREYLQRAAELAIEHPAAITLP